MTCHAARSIGQPGAPLILTFHGTGGTEDQFHGLASQLIPGAHVASPRGDVSEGGALRFFRRTAEGVYDMADLARASARIRAFVAGEARRTGATRVIGLGYSNGANILAATAFDAPGLFSDLILLHPLIPFTPAPQPGLKTTRILITAGQRDPICPPALTRALSDWFRAQGSPVTDHWHPGGHEIRPDELAAVQTFLL